MKLEGRELGCTERRWQQALEKDGSEKKRDTQCQQGKQ